MFVGLRSSFPKQNLNKYLILYTVNKGLPLSFLLPIAFLLRRITTLILLDF